MLQKKTESTTNISKIYFFVLVLYDFYTVFTNNESGFNNYSYSKFLLKSAPEVHLKFSLYSIRVVKHKLFYKLSISCITTASLKRQMFGPVDQIRYAFFFTQPVAPVVFNPEIIDTYRLPYV
jgi:hypothetical protein